MTASTFAQFDSGVDGCLAFRRSDGLVVVISEVNGENTPSQLHVSTSWKDRRPTRDEAIEAIMQVVPTFIALNILEPLGESKVVLAIVDLDTLHAGRVAPVKN